MNHFSLAELEKLTHRVADLAIEVGFYIQKERAAFAKDSVVYKGLNDLVTHVDKGAEERLVAGLSTILPEAWFITEEGTAGEGRSATTASPGTAYWIIDPIDGTTNFVHGVPVYAISLALYKDGSLLLGVVYEINRQECFFAWQGGGAYMNGEPIHVNPTATLGESLLATGFPYYDFEKMQAYLGIVAQFMQLSHGLRRMGSAAVDLAYTACGRFDGFFEYNLKPWDVAAGILLVREAGGVVSAFDDDGDPLFGKQIIAGTAVHSEMKATIQQFWGVS